MTFGAGADLAIAVIDLERDAGCDREEAGSDLIACDGSLASLYTDSPAQRSRFTFENQGMAAGGKVLDRQRREARLAAIENDTRTIGNRFDAQLTRSLGINRDLFDDLGGCGRRWGDGY